ncbi:unnamed protein product, partial [Scytosiphon promiscuus]
VGGGGGGGGGSNGAGAEIRDGKHWPSSARPAASAEYALSRRLDYGEGREAGGDRGGGGVGGVRAGVGRGGAGGGLSGSVDSHQYASLRGNHRHGLEADPRGPVLEGVGGGGGSGSNSSTRVDFLRASVVDGGSTFTAHQQQHQQQQHQQRPRLQYPVDSRAGAGDGSGGAGGEYGYKPTHFDGSLGGGARQGGGGGDSNGRS